ncbi:5'-3' exonuclease H3TH domain-containing protein [Cupriavidus sp. TMH.W2]|uniref:5'-3' exonuclease family protein n=1 Tax=Cupriavidus sp. TMH.W2 TaxID=3434465 RepID=UPI003D780B9D
MTTFMLVDGNSVGYANQYSHTLTAQGMEVQAISGTLRSLSKRIREFPDYFPALLWDGRAQWRFDLYQDYKSNRLKSETSRAARAAYEKQQPFLRVMAAKLGLTQIIAESAEADDVGFQSMQNLVSMGHKVIFVTSDTDWLQGMREGMSWLDPKTGKLIASAADMEQHVGTGDPRAYIEAKALEGDVSDSIPGISRVGIKTALKVFAQYGGSMASFYDQVDAGNVDLKKKVLNSLASAEGRSTFARNMRLMDLAAAPALSVDDLVVTKEPVDPVVFTDWAEHFSFQSILRNVSDFIAPFESAAIRPGYTELMLAISNLGDQR